MVKEVRIKAFASLVLVVIWSSGNELREINHIFCFVGQIDRTNKFGLVLM